MIELKNVSKIYPNGSQALENVSLIIPKGEMVYLTGKSGSGKSTLLKLLYKAEEVTSGNIFMNQTDLSKVSPRSVYKLRRDIGIVFQDFKLLPHLTVYENVAYALEVIGEKEELIERKVLDTLELVGLEDKANLFPSDCSGGEQQRIAIARAICKSPTILLADEPTGNLDPKMSEEILRIFYRINRQGTTVIIATHNWELIRKFPYRVLQMHEGKLLSDRSRSHVSILVSEDFHNLLSESYD